MSAAASQAGDGFSAEPSISADGRFVAFASEADNLSDEDVDDLTNDIFVRDLQSGTTTFVEPGRRRGRARR